MNNLPPGVSPGDPHFFPPERGEVSTSAIADAIAELLDGALLTDDLGDAVNLRASAAGRSVAIAVDNDQQFMVRVEELYQ